MLEAAQAELTSGRLIEARLLDMRPVPDMLSLPPPPPASASADRRWVARHLACPTRKP